MAPEDALGCLATAHDRPAAARWIGVENVLVLAFVGDDEAEFIDGWLRDPVFRDGRTLALLPADFDQGLATLTDFLAARASGDNGHASNFRFTRQIPDGPGDQIARHTAAFRADMLRRGAANAVDPVIEALGDPITAERIGAAALELLHQAGAEDRRLYRVTFPGSTDAGLTTEEYVAFRIPDSTTADWSVIRVAGAPYPDVPPE